MPTVSVEQLAVFPSPTSLFCCMPDNLFACNAFKHGLEQHSRVLSEVDVIVIDLQGRMWITCAAAMP